MKIDMHNYESYLLDYQDGKLSQDEIERLRDFVLSQGMDWDALSEELPQLEAPEMHFDGKEALLQSEIAPLGPVNKNNYESYFVAYHEGLLGEEEQRQVLCFIRINDSLSDDFKLFGLSWLKPDTNEVFQGKESLKKESRVIPLFRKVAAVAAAMVLLFVAFWRRNESLPVQEMVAELKPIEAVQIVSMEPEMDIPTVKMPAVPQQIVTTHTHQSVAVSERSEMSLLAVLEPVAAQEATLSKDYLIAHNLVPDMQLYPMNMDYAFAESLMENDFEEEATGFGSLIGRGISQISNGRYGSVGELFGRGMRRATRQVIKTSAKVVMTAYYKTDYHIEEAKGRWQEKLDRENRK